MSWDVRFRKLLVGEESGGCKRNWEIRPCNYGVGLGERGVPGFCLLERVTDPSDDYDTSP